MTVNTKLRTNRSFGRVALVCALLLSAVPASAWWGDAYRTPTGLSGGWATIGDCGTYWYTYGRNTSCTVYNRWAQFIPGFGWSGRGNIKMDWVYTASMGYLGQRLRYYNSGNGLTGQYTEVNMCANGCSWARVLDGNTNNMYDWNGIYIDCNESWDVGCGSNCGVKPTSCREIHMWGDKWVYLNDWTVFGGYGTANPGAISDLGGAPFPWGEAGLYAYPAVDTSRGTYVRDTLFGNPRTPFRVHTGDCGHQGLGNYLNFKGNASNGNNNNCDYCNGYAFSWVYTSGGAGPQVSVGSDDGYRVWINGSLVGDSNVFRGVSHDQDNIGAKGLAAGWNRVLFKVHNGGGGFGGVMGFHHGSDWAQMEPSVALQGDRYGGFSVGYEQNDWYPRVDVANFEGLSNPQPNNNVYTNDTTINFSGTASGVTVPLWTVLNYQWGYGISGNTTDAQVSSPGGSWSHQQTGVTGHRRFHFFSVSRSGRLSLQPNGLSGGGNTWADGTGGNYMDVFVDNLTPNNPSFNSVTAASNTTSISLAWTVPLDRGVNIADGADEQADEANTYPTSPNHYRRGNVGVRVLRNGSTEVYAWNTGTSASDTGLTPNTTYTYTLAARDNTSQSRGAWANTTSYVGSTPRYTLAAVPSVGNNADCDKATDIWYGLATIGTGFTFSNPAGFGAGTHGGNQYKVSKYKYIWKQSGSHTFDGSEADWNTGTLNWGPGGASAPAEAGAPDKGDDNPPLQTEELADGVYYLHLQSWNEENAATPGKLAFGPFQYDGTRPTITIGNPSRSAANNTHTVTCSVTFTETVEGLTESGITVNLTGTANPNLAITPNEAEPTRFWTATFTNLTGDGTVNFSVNENAALDRAGNGNVASANSQTFTIDNTPPTCAITRNSPAGSPTNAPAGYVQFRITFSESVTGFTIDDLDFTKDPGIITGDLGNFSGSADTYFVRVNNVSGTGFVSIDVDAATAQDAATNLNLAADPVENYFIDQGAFTCSITRTDDNPTNADTVGYRLEFNKEPAAFVQNHITLGGSIIDTNLANFAVDPEDAKVYTVDVTDISGTGTVSIAIAADTVYDYPGNPLTPAGPLAYTIDQGAITGTITRTSTNPTNADTVGYQIALNKEPVDFDVDDLQLGGTVGGTSLDNFTYVGEVEGEFLFTVDVIDINGTGTVSLALPADTIHDEASNTNNEIPAVAYTIDQTPPTVLTINRHTPTVQTTNLAQVTWRVTFSEQVTNIDTDDFTLVDVNNSIAGEEVLSVSTATGQTVDVTVSTGTSGNGDLRLDVIMPGATIDDTRGNPMGLGFITGQVYTLDRAAPIIESIARLDPTGQNTNASEVTWRVTFSRNVNNVDTDDFTLNTTGTLAGVEVTEVSAASGTTIDVTASTGTGNGQLRLYVLVPPATITDDVGNTLATDFTAGQLYVLDRTALTCQINRTSPNPNNAVSVGYQVVFNKDVSDFTLNDVTLGGTVPNTLLSSFSGSGMTYTFNVTNIQASGTVSVELAVGVAHDISGNPNTGCGPVEYTIDKEALFCSIFRLSGNPTNADTVSFQINFNKSVSDFAVGDITLGGLAGTSLDNFSGSGSSYTVDVVDIAGSGQVSIELAAGVAHDAASNPNSGCGPIAYTIDHTGPTCNIIRSSANPNSSSTVGYQISFNEPVTGFTVNDLVLGGSIEDTQLADFVPVSSTVYTVNVVNIVGSGTVSLEVPADVADDALGNPNTGCGPLAYTIDQEEVLVTVNQQTEQEDPTPWLPILFDVEFTKPVIGFAVGDVVFTGTASGISYSIQGSGASYTIQVNGVSVPGTVRPTLPADVARDAAFNWNQPSTSDDNTVTYDPAPTPTITGWRSVRTHGGQGPLSIALNPSAVVTEPRRNSVQRLEIDFDQAVQPENGSLDLTDVSIQDTQSNGYQATTLQLVNNGLRLVVQFSPGLLPSGKRYTIDLGDNFKGTSPPYPLVGGTRSCQVRVLEGDANGDGTVNVQDLVIIKNANREPAAEENCHLDVSADGEVNIIDLAITNTHLGQSAP